MTAEIFDVSNENGDFNFDEIMGDGENSPADIDDNLLSKINAKNQKKMETEIVKSIVREPKDPAETKKHQELVLHLVRYGNSKRFCEYLKSLGFQLTSSNLKKMTNDELNEILTRVQTSLDNKSVSNFWSELAFGGIQTTEMIVSSTKLGEKIKIQGLTDSLRDNDEFLDLIELLELSYANFTHVRPEIRLLYTLMSSGMKVHAVNSFMEKMKKMLEKEEVDVRVETDVDDKVNKVDSKVNKVDSKVNKVDTKVDNVDTKVNNTALDFD